MLACVLLFSGRRLNDTFVSLEDEEIDVPEVGTYAGQLLLVLVRDGGLPLSAVCQIDQSNREAAWADKMTKALFGGLLTTKVRGRTATRVATAERCS
jgi:hypothetical protein